MPTYKNIRIKKKGGGSRLQRVQVLASGKYKFVKNKKSSKKTTKKKTKSKRNYSVAKKKKTTRRSRRKIPLSTINGLLTSVYASPIPGWSSVMENVAAKNIPGAAQSFLAAWTGIRIPLGGQEAFEFNPMEVFNPFDMRYAPAWKATFWTKLATKLTRKIIKQDPFSRIPFVKDYVSFS